MFVECSLVDVGRNSRQYDLKNKIKICLIHIIISCFSEENKQRIQMLDFTFKPLKPNPKIVSCREAVGVCKGAGER